jgi:hypothetical protein
MKMNPLRRLIPAMVVIFGLLAMGSSALAAPPRAKAKHHNHHDGKQLVGEKIKTDGRHEIHQKGKYHTVAEVRGGKIAGIHVKHEEKGEIPVTKYKTHQKMAFAGRQSLYASLLLAQMQDMGTVYIGYSYVDDNGEAETYWFPYDMVVDGDTGAVEYVPEG